MQKISNKIQNTLRVVIFGDITGVAGRETAKEIFPLAKKEWQADLLIANAENSSHGFGITPKHIQELKSYGVDLLTMGNHTWDKHLLRHKIKNFNFITRPLNLPKESPGTGYVIYDTPFGKFALINLLGRLFMNPVDCPYHAVFDLVKKLKNQYKVKMIAIDFHAEASAEKQIMGHFLDGKVSIIWGTHTHVQTADETILSNGTGYITDIGMTGAAHSIIGFEINAALKKTIYGEPFRNQPETKGERISSGIIADIDPYTGHTLFITRFREIFPSIDNLIEDPNSKMANYTSEIINEK